VSKRAVELLKVVREIMQRQNESGYVLNILEETAFYDGAECDGYCLLDDIEIELERIEE